MKTYLRKRIDNGPFDCYRDRVAEKGGLVCIPGGMEAHRQNLLQIEQLSGQLCSWECLADDGEAVTRSGARLPAAACHPGV